MANPLYQKHFLSSDQITKENISLLFREIDTMKTVAGTKGKIDSLNGKIIACVFFEPSTRTFASFMSAAQRLGAGVIPFYGMTNSSVNKGETLEDTIRTIGCSTDLIVLRHPEKNAVQAVAGYSYVPVVNAGDGGHEHPTQALLDAYTIHNRFPSFENLTIGMAGDLLHSRTIRSLSKVLAKLGVKKFIWISSGSLRMLPDVAETVRKHTIEIVETNNLESVIGELDVLYANRAQKERFANQKEYEKVKDLFVVTPQTLSKAKPSMILMDPLPRVGEISPEVDSDPRALYIKEQMQNGLYTRMALLKLILSNNP